MARTLEMFEKPRKKREWLMHVTDCGDGNCGVAEEGETFVVVRCNRCGHESEWMWLPVKIAKNGLPCPKCNAVPNE